MTETSLTGSVIAEADPEYVSARLTWNRAVDRRPAVIVRAAAVADVVAAVRYGQEHGLEIAVRGGAHNVAGAAVCDGGLVVDLAQLSRVVVDPRARTVRCGGGARWAQVDAATQRHGLATPGGTYSDTGIGGLTLGGGVGWLTPRCGLTIDNLLSARVVIADGRILRAAADEHPDLFWALRGGGGNFGVVTEFEFRLHELGPTVDFGLYFVRAARGRAGLRLMRELIAGLPAGTGHLLGGMTSATAPYVPPDLRQQTGFVLLVADTTGSSGFGGVLDRIERTLAPDFQLVAPLRWTELQQLLNSGIPPAICAYETSVYVDELSDGVLDVLAEHWPRRESAMSRFGIFPLCGAYCAVADEDSAFGGSRHPGYLIDLMAITETSPQLDGERRWTRECWQALAPFAGNSAGYVNFMADCPPERVRQAYGDAKYERLARIKAAYDPHNVFHHNPNIQPRAATA